MIQIIRKSLLLAAVLCCCNFASARGFMVKAGVEFPHYNISTIVADLNFKELTGWHAGIAYQTRSFSGFSFQPELLFQHGGMDGQLGLESIRMNNLEVVGNVQWGVDLLLFRPFIFAAPFVSYDLTDIKQLLNLKKWDYGVGAGLGVDIWKLQITAKYNWAFGGIVDWKSYLDSVQDIKANTGAVILSLGFKF